MKKLLTVFSLVAILIALASTSVFASANDDLINELSKTYTIAGKNVSISDADKVKIERYLEDNPVTETQKDAIISKVNEIVAVMEKEGVSDPAKLSKDKKNEVISLAKEAASTIDLKLVVDSSNDTVSVYNAEGKLIEKMKVENGKLSYTGNNSYMYIVVPVAVIAIATLAIYRKKVNA